jgi:hypothetical protein
MLRAPGRKIVELKIRMCNFAESSIDHSRVSASAGSAVKHSSLAHASVDHTQTARSQSDFLKLGLGIRD